MVVVTVDLPKLRTALDLPVSVLADEQLQAIVDACADTQSHYLTPDPTLPNPALTQALVRRVGRAVTARGIPLGAQNTEFGTMYVPQWDPILQELEAPYRPPVVS